MLGKCSFIILGPVLAASLALPQGFAAEAVAAPSQANLEVTAPSADNECDKKEHGCAKGLSDGLFDGRSCLHARPGDSPNSGEPDYSYGYAIGHAAGWKEKGCGGASSSGTPQKQSRKAEQRAAGEARGVADAATHHRCKRSSYRGHSNAFKRGYKDANQHC
jgi:hypothetical protein